MLATSAPPVGVAGRGHVPAPTAAARAIAAPIVDPQQVREKSARDRRQPLMTSESEHLDHHPAGDVTAAQKLDPGPWSCGNGWSTKR
jgi:hypothetical protein